MLVAFVRALPIETLAEKRTAVKAVNGRLRSLGLAIRCPKTGLAARLVAHPGNHPERGRFQIELLGDPPRRRTFSTPDPPPLELMPEPPKREPMIHLEPQPGRSNASLTQTRTPTRQKAAATMHMAMLRRPHPAYQIPVTIR